jgi:hypothetical protein
MAKLLIIFVFLLAGCSRSPEGVYRCVAHPQLLLDVLHDKTAAFQGTGYQWEVTGNQLLLTEERLAGRNVFDEIEKNGKPPKRENDMYAGKMKKSAQTTEKRATADFDVDQYLLETEGKPRAKKVIIRRFTFEPNGDLIDKTDGRNLRYVKQK